MSLNGPCHDRAKEMGEKCVAFPFSCMLLLAPALRTYLTDLQKRLKPGLALDEFPPDQRDDISHTFRLFSFTRVRLDAYHCLAGYVSGLMFRHHYEPYRLDSLSIISNRGKNISSPTVSNIDFLVTSLVRCFATTTSSTSPAMFGIQGIIHTLQGWLLAGRSGWFVCMPIILHLCFSCCLLFYRFLHSEVHQVHTIHKWLKPLLVLEFLLLILFLPKFILAQAWRACVMSTGFTSL